MMRSSVDKRAYDREPPRQVVSDYEIDPAEKHDIRCDCAMCRCAWNQMTIKQWNKDLR